MPFGEDLMLLNWGGLNVCLDLFLPVQKTFQLKEEMLVTSIFSFFHNCFIPITDLNHHFLYFYIILSANASNLDQAKILSFDKALDGMRSAGFSPEFLVWGAYDYIKNYINMKILEEHTENWWVGWGLLLFHIKKNRK